MSDIISEINTDIDIAKNNFYNTMRPIIQARLEAQGLEGTLLTNSTNTIVDAIKEQENIIIESLVTIIYHTIQDKILDKLQIKSNQVVTNVTQDLFTKIISVTKEDVIAVKSFI